MTRPPTEAAYLFEGLDYVLGQLFLAPSVPITQEQGAYKKAAPNNNRRQPSINLWMTQVQQEHVERLQTKRRRNYEGSQSTHECATYPTTGLASIESREAGTPRNPAPFAARQLR
jgi:hypothetical protein